jgi:hypothetical protein
MKTVIAGVNHCSAGAKTHILCRLFALIAMATLALRAPAMVFTENTEIGPGDTTYDGQDIVILDCTVSIDGPHTFSSLVLAANGVLTHSASTNGQLSAAFNVTNAPYVLSGTLPYLLANSNIFSPLLLTDTNGGVYTNGVDYLAVPIINNNYEISRTATSSIPDGGTVLVSYSYYGSVPAGLDLMVTGVVWVTSGCEIDAEGIGYGAGFGPGAGSNSSNMFFAGSGGGYGGSGGTSLSNAVGGVCYDSLYQPALPGSGGGASYAGSGGNGGGLVSITSGDEVEIDGAISANGYSATNSRSGGGSGGGIFISAPTFSGVGSLSANGGSGVPDGGGGGGGGRIAVVCGTNNFSGTTTAYGGGGKNYGGAGTLFTELTGSPGLVALNNNANLGANSTVTLPVLADMAVSNGAVVAASGAFVPRIVTIGTNGVLTGQPQTPLQFAAYNLTVTAGGAVSVNGLGFGGEGVTYTIGGVTYGGGGGQGGYGGASAVTNAGGGIPYDSQADPIEFGAGGGGSNNGGAGGGAININLSGALQMNGLISANAANGAGIAGGGGSGGSVYMTAATFSGAGVVTANGGGGANLLGGGGGGGRIAISAGTDIFAGAIDCFGGAGANYGGAGTIFLSQTGASPGQDLVLDNGGNVGPSTPVQSASAASLDVQDDAWGTLAAGSTFENLFVASNSWVTVPPASGAALETISSNATFQAGGGFTLNSDGLNSFQQGLGQYLTIFPYAAGGGGNGGAGGAGGTNTAAGGAAGFNEITEPNYPGGNGGGFNPYSIGGIGGGAVRMTVGGTLQVNGVMSANGGNGSGDGAGGGAGGTLALSAGFFAGSGSITANGGNGADSMGGGGGGGIIAITFKTNLFNGTMSAFGGAGANYGGAGIIYTKTNSFLYGQIIVDNGGRNGAISAFSSIQGYPPANLTVRDNSTLVYRGVPQFGGLELGTFIITNATVLVSNSPMDISANNIFVQNGGRFSADAGGNVQNLGPGAGRAYGGFPYPGGGGGNGGCGGMSISNLAVGGGGAFQPYYESTEAGSGGGGELPYSTGGSGGGVIELNVSGTLAVNGTLSANGGNGTGTGGGGGAGGSLDLITHTLTGSGEISANGGNGANNIGGGGGGGMIVINLEQTPTNSFTGNISAYGGLGATNGGAGTLFMETNGQGAGTLIVDNGGNRGTNTPITYSSSTHAVVIRNGTVVTFPNSAAFSSLLIASNGWLIPNIAQAGAIGDVSLSLTLGATIQAGGGIIADSDGYLQNVGNGHGSSLALSPTYPCSGAGHGGYGAFGLSNLVPGGVTYDSIETPQFGGSGGGGDSPFSTGGNGGGMIQISAKAATLQINGMISANGGNGSGIGGGGGSGGAIYLTANSIIGTGSITANGGNGAPYGGGGGGGCIALAGTAELRTNLFLGAISAYGGGGVNYGGAGTLYYSTNVSAGNQPAELYLDNDGNVGTDTTLNVNGPIVVIQNGAIGAIQSGDWTPDAVLVLSNSELTSLIGQATVQAATVQASSITIATGGVFSVDGGGYAAQTGPGAGSVIGGISGGGGHGGFGGGNSNSASTNGTAYDSIQAPKAVGSGGANSSAGSGGAGGGALNLILNTLVVNGRLSANGRAGGIDAGGGSGGSIDIGSSGFAPLSVTGNGIISANGGASSGSGGGGAGGRIAVPTSPLFTGQLSAGGGAGGLPGGAGTVFSSSVSNQTLLINNGGLTGANTPLSSSLGLPSSPFELDISGGASVVPLTPLPLLSNLNVSASSTLTMPIAQSALSIGVIGNAAIAGDLDVDSLGYSQTNGPGAGVALNGEGSGGGYGGAGGASENGAPGGKTYGSAAGPTDFGSGGGNGADTTTGGSEGGGALRLSVTGSLTVNGNISANGDSGLQDDSGGGSGGSVWITVGTLSGAGTISAFGGDGVLYGGGGGGGGRIAVYAQTNQFTGTTNVSGGLGIVSGQPGTVSMFAGFNGLQILSQSPTGTVLNAVSSVNLIFSDILNASSVFASEFTLVTPTGPLSTDNLYVAIEGPNSVQLSFPTQGAGGTYTVQVAPTVSDMFGQSLTQPYTGTFTISAPVISGTVTGTNGAGVAGVSIQATSLATVITDTNGNYSLSVPYGWTGTVTPSFGSYIFSPPSMSYASVAASVTNQNFSAFQFVSPALTASQSAGRWTLNWNGIPGVTYQVLFSTNLMTWQPLGSPIPGSSGSMEYSMPAGSNSQEFFQIQAGD